MTMIMPFRVLMLVPADHHPAATLSFDVCVCAGFGQSRFACSPALDSLAWQSRSASLCILACSVARFAQFRLAVSLCSLALQSRFGQSRFAVSLCSLPLQLRFAVPLCSPALQCVSLCSLAYRLCNQARIIILSWVPMTPFGGEGPPSGMRCTFHV